MKVLIGCEFSGIIRDSFAKKGHDAMSCDLLPTKRQGKHYQGPIENIITDEWDLMIAHPPCTYLAVSGNRWMKNNPERQLKRKLAISFFLMLMTAPIEKICVENPVSVISSVYRKPDQYIQPYEFGHPETKKTGLWLKNLPKLKPVNIVKPEFIIGKDGKKYSPKHFKTQWSAKKYYGMERSPARSISYQGIADAMANQWG